MDHSNDPRSIIAHDIFSVNQEECEDGTKEHKDNESNVGSIIDLICNGVETLGEGNLKLKLAG